MRLIKVRILVEDFFVDPMASIVTPPNFSKDKAARDDLRGIITVHRCQV